MGHPVGYVILMVFRRKGKYSKISIISANASATSSSRLHLPPSASDEQRRSVSPNAPVGGGGASATSGSASRSTRNPFAWTYGSRSVYLNA